MCKFKVEAFLSPNGPKGGKQCQDLEYEFVLVSGTKGSLVTKKSLFMQGSTTTMIKEGAIWISKQVGSGENDDWHEVKFGMGDFGTKTVAWMMHDTGPSGEAITVFLCHIGPIVVKHCSGKLDGPQVFGTVQMGKCIMLKLLLLHLTTDDLKVQIYLKKAFQLINKDWFLWASSSRISDDSQYLWY